MTKIFQYSVLQYKHSLTLGEAVNVGILFFFPESEKLAFTSDSGNRLKSIYQNFDSGTFHQLLSGIANKIKNQDHLFHKDDLKVSLKTCINSYVLNEDSTALQFNEPITALHIFETDQKAVDSYSKILLPWLAPQAIQHPTRHTEAYLLRTYTDFVFKKEKTLKEKIKRNQIVETKDVSLKFDIAWQNGSLNLVKPISFDLSDEQSIQTKSATYFGYLTLLNEKAVEKNYRFDILISRPQNKSLFKAYSKALEVLHDASAPKRLITEDKLKDYSDETIRELLNH